MRRLPVLAALLALLGAVLRLVPFWGHLTWYDENFTALLARLPFRDMLTATAADVHPPLYYAVCWLLAHAVPGLPAWAITRLPALVFGLACLPVWWKILTITVNSHRVRLAAFGLFCILPSAIYYSQEGRMYSLLTLLVLLAWLALLTRRWVLYGVLIAALCWTHNYGALYGAALWLAGLLRDRRDWRPLTLATALGGLTFAAWLGVLVGQMEIIQDAYWMVHLSWLSPFQAATMSVFSQTTVIPWMVNSAAFWALMPWVIIHAVRTRTLDLPAVTLTFAPLGLALAISLLWQPIILNRALTPSGPFAALLLAAPVDWLLQRPRRWFLYAVILLPVIFANNASTAARYTLLDSVLARSYNALDYIAYHWQPGDTLLSNDDGVFVLHHGADLWPGIDSLLRVPACGVVRGGLSPATRAAVGMQSGDPPETGRVWSIVVETPLNPECEQEAFAALGVFEHAPLFCIQDDKFVSACLYYTP